MSVNRRAAKRDTVEREIIDALIAAGCTVQQLSAKGCPDLLVGYTTVRLAYRGNGDGEYYEDVQVNLLMEVKTGKAKLTPDEVAWHEKWQGQVCVVRSVEDAYKAVGRIKYTPR